MTVAEAIARILKDEGVEQLVCYPRNLLIDACAEAGIPPVICRQERIGVHIADGISRSTNGKRIGVFAPQGGPGIENAFAGVAQSFSDNTPILVLPGASATSRSHTPPAFSAVDNFAHVTKWACELDDPRRIWEVMRRAFHALRTGKSGPVLVELIGRVVTADCGEYAYEPVRPLRMGADPAAVRNVADLLLTAERPVIHAGQGILYADARAELIELAELLEVPVLTTNTGKSAFPENHPLGLGAMVISAPKAAFRFLKTADLIFGAGTSFSRTTWGPQIPPGKRIVHLTNCAADIYKEHPVEAAILGDAKLALRALIDAVGTRRRPSGAVAAEVAELKASWRAEWANEFAADEVPINQYRILGDLHALIDPAQTIATHEAGSPREQMVPFWESTVERDYLGWGKSTMLGAGLGMIMGAKIAHPEKLCINVMGDASIGMVGMDLETAVRHRLGIMTIVFNNGMMAGEREGMEKATERYHALDLGGNYSAVASALGTWSRRVERPGDFAAVAREAIAVTQTGRPVLIEVMAKQCERFSRY
jgi:thiamine pyrophosphate-dependent acetolactate synthase large subunit-like protein